MKRGRRLSLALALAFSLTSCTRAHVVTFLWRTEGQPAAGGANPFTDVPSGQYDTNAVLWAVSKNITNGTSPTTFSPDNPCTRGRIVTFLYRDMKESKTGSAPPKCSGGAF